MGKKATPTWRPHRFAAVILVCVIVYALLGFLAVPWVAERTAIQKLDEALGLQLSLGDVSFNPFTFVAKIEELDARYASGDRLAYLDSVVVDLQTTALFGGRIVLSELRIDGASISLRKAADGQIDVITLADTGSPEPSPGSEGPGWPVEVESLLIDDAAISWIDNSVAPAAQLGIEHLVLEATGLSTVPESRFPVTTSLTLTSGGAAMASGEISLLPALVVALDVELDKLSLAALNPYAASLAGITVESGILELAGTTVTGPPDPFIFTGDLAVNDLLVTENQMGTRLGSWSRVAATGIAMSIARRSLTIPEVSVDQPYADIQIAEDGSINLGRAGAEQIDDEPEDATQESEPFALAIGGIAINDGRLTFTDRMLPIPFTVEVSELQGAISAIDSGTTDPANISLEGRVDEFGELAVSGSVTPLDPQQESQIEASFNNLDIPRFSPYTVRFAGHEIASGKLDLDLTYAIAEAQLEGNHDIVLRDFELGEKVPHPDAADLPLTLAIALLRDPSGKIDIDLPISGDMNDPEFSISGVVGKAFGNLLGGIVTSPFKLLAGLVGSGEGELGELVFRPGRDDLSPSQQEAAANLAQALLMRPQLQLEIAGTYHADADAEVLSVSAEEALIALAKRRAENTLAAIVAREPDVASQVSLGVISTGRLDDDGQVRMKVELRTR